MIEKVERLNDLIDRQALVDELNAIADEAEAAALAPGVVVAIPITDALRLVYAQPTQVDYKMVKHSKWENTKRRIYGFLLFKCSLCGATVVDIDKGSYCPYCGASMDLSE